MTQIIFLAVLAIWIAFCLYSIIRPELALSLALSLYSVEQILLYGFPGTIQITAVKITVGASVLLTLGYGFASGRIRLNRIPSIVLNAAIFFGLALLATQWGPDPETQMDIFLKYSPYAILFWFLVPLNFSEQLSPKWQIESIVIMGGVVFTAYLFCEIQNRGILVNIQRGDAVMNPLLVASFASVTIIAISFSFFESKATKLIFAIKLVVAFLCVYAIIKSGARGQLIGLVAALGFWTPLTVNNTVRLKRYLPLLLFFFVIVVGWQLLSLSENVTSTSRWQRASMYDSSNTRLDLISQSLSQYAKANPVHWLFGLGYGALTPLIGAYPHNIPVEILVELGVVGLLIYLSIILRSFQSGRRLMKSPTLGNADKNFVGFSLTLLTFFALLSLKEGSFLRGETLLPSCLIAWMTFKYDQRIRLSRQKLN